jgi:Skp family chaperone for outer membrane proteins
MKIKMIALISLFGFCFLLLSRDYSQAQISGPASKIGTINIERVSMDCAATKEYMKKATEESQKLKADEESLKKSIQALEAELDEETYKVGSDEFYKKNRELAQKKSQLSYLQDFNQQEIGLKTQLWKMDLYSKILKVANEIGSEKDLYLVLAVENPELSKTRVEEFANVVRAHKVLYSGGCVDLTDAVITKLNQLTQAGK